MEKQSLGSMIASLRKQRGMTQLDLAVKMGVTDKAVSKWERDLLCPDISLLPRLAELFGVSVDELMNAKGDRDRRDRQIKNGGEMLQTVLKAVGLAMGVAAAVLSFMGRLGGEQASGMLGIGLACLALCMLYSDK